LVADEKISQNEIDFVPAQDEVARRAYFSYVNQGSAQGHEVQHWLAAEAELIAERKLTRIHGFHNKT
jgi:antirestriction protein ArdC